VLARRLFRLGPVVLLPFVILWAAACNRIGMGESYEWWRGYPMYAAIALAALWHLALLVLEKHRLDYLMNAIAHFPIFLLVAFTSYIHATRAPL
jgi:hypothetical protein